MMRRFGWLLLPAALVACDREEPIGIGEELLPGEAVTTFEVTLNAADYLQLDTAFALYGSVESADFTILARNYAGALNANAFARFDIPTIIGVVDTLGISRIDSLPRYVRAELFMAVDTIATEGPTVTRVALNRFGETWDPDSAGWEFRSPGVRWTVPGGTPGVLVDTATYTRGDTLRLAVDSATLATWTDSTDLSRGALLSLVDAPARLRASIPRLRVFMRSRYKPDTLFSVIASAPETRFVFEPKPDSIAPDVRFNGTPAWRTFLQFRPNLRNLVISCGTGCSVPLQRLDISRAELLFTPLSPRAGFDPELPTTPIAYAALVAPQIPLARTPLGNAVGTTVGTIDKEDLVTGAPPVRVIVTEFMRQMVQDTTTDGSTGRTDWLAIISAAPRTFGYGRFEAGPRLRLVLSTAREVQLP